MTKQRVTTGLLIAAPVVMLLVALYGRFLWAPPGTAPAERDGDFYLFAYPLADFAFEVLSRGTIPLWNPYIDCGVPLLVSLQQGVLYPPNWLHLLLPTARAFNLLIVLHVVFAAAGTWLFCRGRGRSHSAASLSAMVFVAGGIQVMHFHEGQGMVVFSMAWLPWILWQIDRLIVGISLAGVCRLAVLLACQCLAGFPLFTLVLAYLVPVYLLVMGVDWASPAGQANRRLFLACGGSAVLALGLVAVQLLPTIDFVNEAHRGELTYDVAASFSLPTLHLVRAVVPDFLGNPVTSRDWGHPLFWNATIFCGVAPLVLAVLGLGCRRRREVMFWLMAAILFLSYCVGGVVFDICYLYLPGFDLFRRPLALRMFVTFAVAVLAAIGIDRIRSEDFSRRQLVAGFLIVIGVGGLAIGLAGHGGQLGTPSWWGDLVRHAGGDQAIVADRQLLAGAFQVAAGSLAVSAGVVLATGLGVALSRRPSVGTAVPCLIGFLVAGELFAFGHPFLQTSRVADKRDPSSRVHKAIAADDGVYRLACLSDEQSRLFNRFMLDRIQTVGGAEDLIPRRYSYFLYALTGQPPFLQHVFSFGPDTPRPVKRQYLDLLNVRYYACPHGAHSSFAVDLRGDTLLEPGVFSYEGVTYDLFLNADALPRATIVHEWRVVSPLNELLDRAAGDDQVLLRLLEDRVQPLLERSIVGGTFLEEPPGIARGSSSGAATADEHVEIIAYKSNRVLARVHLDRAGLIVFSDTYVPDWQATVDGKPARVLPANLFMRAVPCEAGDHLLELTYAPPAFRYGAWITAGSLIALVVLVVLAWRRRRATRPIGD